MSETRGGKKWLLLPIALLGVLVLIAALYLLFVLNWSYSRGERVGYVQKFSQKGWICKTWEGELAIAPLQIMQPEKFLFTVRDDAVAARLNQALGRKMALVYEEHRGIPTSCFGETGYFVVDVRLLE